MSNETQKKMISGHSDTRTTARVYFHHNKEATPMLSVVQTRKISGHRDTRTIARVYFHADK